MATAICEDGTSTSFYSIFDESTVKSNGEMNEIVRKVQTRGAAIINALQASSAFSAANAIIKHLKDWIGEGATDEVFSMGVLSNGNSYGVADGLVFSFPCRRTGSGLLDGGYQIVSGFPIDAYTQDQLTLTEAELVEERSEASEIVGSLILTNDTSKL